MFYTTDPKDRAEFIGSLRQLADFLADNPHLPVPTYGAEISLHTNLYEDGGKEQVDHIARQLGTPIIDNTPDGHYFVYRMFGRLGYKALSIPGTRMAWYDARHSYDDSITLA
jgi:hypothetical protein